MRKKQSILELIHRISKRDLQGWITVQKQANSQI